MKTSAPERHRLGPLGLLLLAACAGGASDSGAPGADGDDASGDGGATEPSDEDLLRAAIAGEADAAETLDQLTKKGGLPVETASGTFLFACLCGDGAWSIAGDHDDWAGAPMADAGGLWWAEVSVPAPDGSGYKFRDDSGAEPTWWADPLGRRFVWDAYGELSLVRSSGAHLERYYGLSDGAGLLLPRDLQVWVPAGPVTHLLIAHDGQNLFDPDPAPPATSWFLDQSLPEGVLVVGIDNTPDRMWEYTPVEDELGGEVLGGGAAIYGDFVEDTVRPFIEGQYGAPPVRGLLGSSLGGVVSLSIADQHPGVYDMVLSLSGTVGWGSIGRDGPTIAEAYRGAGRRPTGIYLDSGGGGECWDADGDGVPDDNPEARDNYCENAWLRDILADELGYTFEEDLWHWHEPGAAHNEAAWAARVWRPLEIFKAQSGR